ncbi:galactokinase [Powellomyces hirtus]|uniref:Galactokinase n=1 Tax=Powellomyces hirtus TaxID=109895 RepID=A0A507E3D4_9FUNG|nr:galactokinase [Powellomyces hirtus]
MSSDLSTEFPPSVASLVDVYPTDLLEFQTARYAQLRAAFEKRFGSAPDFYARSPGRVNLIGEHIDYAGYSVLPMAIDRDVVIAVKVVPTEGNSNAKVVLANTDARFPERSFEHEPEGHVSIDGKVHEWSNYFKCGYKGVFEQLASQNTSKNTPVSFYAMVDGTVPAGAGVSSSSAFVCCSALATLHANGGKLNKGALTNAAIQGERYAGVQCGGMDQSISIMAPVGSPLIIHFTPTLSAERIVFPESKSTPVFVIANTLVVADKHVTAPIHYNLRVVETRLAAAILYKYMNGPKRADDAKLLTLRDLQDTYLASKGNPAGFPGNEQTVLKAMSALVEAGLTETPYTREQAAEALKITVEELERRYIGSINIRADTFSLYLRAKHVYEESLRVYQFRDVCAKKAPYSGDLLNDLGSLMNDSQISCRAQFDCSCKEIDELTSIARKAGAFGSRLTGAGWGGCTVSLVAEENVAAFITKVKEDYYFKHWPQWKGDKDAEARMEDYIFASKPSIGAAVITNTTSA